MCGHVVDCWMDNPGDPDVAGVGVSKANIPKAIYPLSITNRPPLGYRIFRRDCSDHHSHHHHRLRDPVPTAGPL
jgi:hypothetical protein